MNGLSFLHLELTSRCNKSCWMCGRRKMEREHPELCDWGDMDFEMVKWISHQVPRGIVVQFHNNGEPLLYPYLGAALQLFPNNIRCLNTNGKLLMEKADEIIGNLETLTISVIQDDPEGEEQYEIVRRFILERPGRAPLFIYRLLGNCDNKNRWRELPGYISKRILHLPEGSRGYSKKITIPEIGICLDLLTHLAIDRKGNVSLCVRFDPEGHLRMGNIKKSSLYSLWNGAKRQAYIKAHIEGRRNELPGCQKCEYWGIPRGD